jgi:hypothetical protein
MTRRSFPGTTLKASLLVALAPKMVLAEEDPQKTLMEMVKDGRLFPPRLVEAVRDKRYPTVPENRGLTAQIGGGSGQE